MQITQLRTYRFATRLLQGWSDDRAASMGAALAYYTVFSIGPILLVSIAIAGWIWGASEAQTAIFRQIEALVGEAGAKTLAEILTRTSIISPDGGFWSGIFGIGLFLLSSTAAFVQLQDDLDAIFHGHARPGSGFISFLWQRLLSLAMLMALGFLLLASLVLDAALASTSVYFGFEATELAYIALNTVTSWILAMIVFALVFKILPVAVLKWRPVLAGAVVSGTLFIIGKFLIGLYIGRANIVTVFGAAGSLITILLWIYYSAQILFLGAEVTKTLSPEYRPKPDASASRAEARAG